MVYIAPQPSLRDENGKKLPIERLVHDARSPAPRRFRTWKRGEEGGSALPCAAMSGQNGTIVELDPIDALGWIELDEGGRVRFGGTALKGFTVNPGVGTRVEVRGTKPGYKGVLKAEVVGPLFTAEEIAATNAASASVLDEKERARVAAEAAKIPWPTFVREHPRWSDASESCVPCSRPAPAAVLTPHPLFAPWHREICDTAPTVVGLVVPGYRALDPIDPGPDDCFAHGRVALLDEPRWPSCGICSRPFEMCLQVSPGVMADFLPGGRGLVALFCFHCGVRDGHDPRVGHVRLVEPRYRVVGPEAWTSASSGWLAATQRVTPRPRLAVVPGASWYRNRSQRVADTASSALFGFDDPGVTGPFPPGADPDWFDELGEEYDDWLAAQPGGDRWGGGCLGGVADWDQADETPSCAHGEMRHLLDYNGGQFLDGSVHVFVCRVQACHLAFVAEF